MARFIETLREIEERVPYHFDNVAITYERVELRQGPFHYEWTFVDTDSATCVITLTSKRLHGSQYRTFHVCDYEREGDREGFMERLLKRYVKKDTKTFNFRIEDDPPALGLPDRILAKNILINMKTEVADFDGWEPVLEGIRNDTKVVFHSNEHSHRLISLLQTPDVSQPIEAPTFKSITSVPKMSTISDSVW